MLRISSIYCILFSLYMRYLHREIQVDLSYLSLLRHLLVFLYSN